MLKAIRINVVGGDPAALSEQVDALQSSTRAIFNRVVAEVERLGTVPSYIDLCKLLTQWRAKGLVGKAPSDMQRGSLMQARTACVKHKAHVGKVFRRLQQDLKQEDIAAAWLATLPDGMEAPDAPKECKAWLNELPEDLQPSKKVKSAVKHKSKKRVKPVRSAPERMRSRKEYEHGSHRPALFVVQGVKRRDARTVYVPGLGDLRLATALKPDDVPRAVQVVERTPYPQGRKGGPPCPAGKRRFALHILVDRPAPNLKDPESGKWGGMDLGVKNTVALSDGRMFHLTPDGASMERYVESQQRQAKLTKGSCAWRKEKKLQKGIWDDLNGRRLNEVRHIVLMLAEEFPVLAVEDLKLISMLRSAQGSASDPGRNVKAKRKLNNRLARAGLGMLQTALAAACAKTGTRLIRVPAHGTSQTCAECGCMDRRNRETQSSFACVVCFRLAHADRNAAQVILERAAQELLHEALRKGGWDGPPARPILGWMCKASLNLLGSDRVEHLRVADLVRARQVSGRLDNDGTLRADAACGDGRGDAVQRLNSMPADMADVELSI